MAGFKGTGVCNATLDAWLGSTTLGPSTVYIVLFTAAPTAGGGGTELSMTGYARVAVTNNSTNFPNAGSASKQNGALIDFGTLTGSGATVIGAAVVKTSSGALGSSDIIYYGPLSVSRAIVSGDAFSLPPSSATFTEA
jgi:hypothetical protein